MTTPDRFLRFLLPSDAKDDPLGAEPQKYWDIIVQYLQDYGTQGIAITTTRVFCAIAGFSAPITWRAAERDRFNDTQLALSKSKLFFSQHAFPILSFLYRGDIASRKNLVAHTFLFLVCMAALEVCACEAETST